MAISTEQQAELIAKRYLKNQGLRFLEANFSFRVGKIDLIMHDLDTTVFVEVRYRKNSLCGSALATMPIQTKKNHTYCRNLPSQTQS